MRDGFLLDGEYRLARDAIEDVHEAVLTSLRDDVFLLAVTSDGHELRRRHQIVVPQIVMGGLVVPEILAGARIEGEEAVREEVRAVAIRSVEVIGGRAQREVGYAALFIDGDFAPGVGAADVFPGVWRPGVIAHLAGMRNGVELPDELAGDDVEGAEISRRRLVLFAGGGAEDEEILEDAARCAGLNLANGGGDAAETFAQVDRAVIAEGRDRSCRCGRRLRAACYRWSRGCGGRNGPCSPNS